MSMKGEQKLMTMKKTIAVTMIAAAISTAAASGAYAAPAPAAAVQIVQGTLNVNGVDTQVRTIVSGSVQLIAVRDLALSLGAELGHNGSSYYLKLNDSIVEFKADSKQITVNGSAQQLSLPVLKVQGVNYIDSAVVSSLGATVDADGGIITINLLEAIDSAQWIGKGKLLASTYGEAGRTDYIVDSKTGKHEVLLVSMDTSDLAIAPDGARAAYVDGEGFVHILDLASKQDSKLGEDNSIKSELQWSADGKALYFLQGDKSSVVAKISAADGTVTKLLEDKVDYKSNLRVEGGTIAYTVVKTGKVTADDKKPVEEDAISIDMTGTEPQVYFYNVYQGDNKPVQLTTSTEDKIFLELSPYGTAYYVSVPEEGRATVASVNKEKQTAIAVAEGDVMQAVKHKEKLYVLTAGETNNLVYQIDLSTGSKKLINTLSDSVTSILPYGNQLALIEDGILYTFVGGSWKAITR
ncbi:stalk domain-containing protein [Paenibacillus tarimensis]